MIQCPGCGNQAQFAVRWEKSRKSLRLFFSSQVWPSELAFSVHSRWVARYFDSAEQRVNDIQMTFDAMMSGGEGFSFDYAVAGARSDN